MTLEKLSRFGAAGNDSPPRVNLILFEAAELSRPLPRSDPRAQHLLEMLRCAPGGAFDAGIINGPRGKATLVTLTAESLVLSFSPHSAVLPAEPITVIVGLPRPQTARDILRDASTLGVAALHFVRTDKSEPGYAQSKLWSSGEWRRHLIAGAEQAFDTRLPSVSSGRTLAEAIGAVPAEARLALDNYEAPTSLAQSHLTPEIPVVVAIGAERGWSARERDLLREQGFQFHHLGSRILRTETACLAALSIIRAKLGLM